MPRDFRVRPTVNGRAVHLDGDAAIPPLSGTAPIGSYPVGSTGFHFTSTQTGWPDFPGFVRTLKTSSTEAFQIFTDIYGESERARSWDSVAVAWRGWTVVNSGNFASVLHGHNAAVAGGASGFMTGADKTKLNGLGGASTPKGHIVDANCVWNTSTSYHVEPGEALVNGALLSWSANIARTGLALVANSAYYVYLFSSAGAAALEESTVAPVYDTSLGYWRKGGATPDSTRRCIGYFPTGTGGAIRRFFCAAFGKIREIYHIFETDDPAPLTLLTGGASTGAWAQVSAGSLVPAHASHGYYAAKINFTGANEDAIIGISPINLGALSGFAASYTVRDKSTTSKTFFGRAWLPLMDGTVYYRLTRVAGTPTAEIECHGARFGV